MKKFKIILVIIVLLGIVGAVVAYFQFNKPHRDASTEKVTHALSASELFNAFDTDEQAAMKEYGNQLLEVSGTIREVTAGSESNPMLILESDNPIFGIKCMFEGPLEKEINTGQSVIVKGFCSGINGDVELTRCAIELK